MSNLPKRFLTIPEVVAKYCPSLIAWKKNSHPNIKTDGALDKPMKRWNGGFVEIDKMYVSTDSQRVKGIQANYLIDKLKEYGGFLHKKTIAEQIYCPKYDIDITVDAMHRAILAWLCDVKEIRRMIVDEHDINDTDEEMNTRECDYMISKNKEGNKLTNTDLERIQKKTNQMTPDQKEQDKLFSTLKISFKDFGCDEDDADLSYPDGAGNFKNLLTNPKSAYYVGEKKFKLYSPQLPSIFEKRVTQKDAMIINALDICDKEQTTQFLDYLDSEEFKDIKFESWTAGCVHQRGIETAVVRILIRFNEWYRDFEDENIMRVDQFDKYLSVLPVEANHVVDSCVVKGKSYDPELWEMGDAA